MPGLPASFPPLRTRQPTVGNLSARLTTFLGRDAELVELGALLEDARLVTLTGPGGIGKTSLGTELARVQAPRFRDGAWFVALDLIDAGDPVMAVIARIIGLFDGPQRAAANGLLPYAADRSMLFVLDNFEHLLHAADEVTALLRASHASRMIVTSRAPLRIPGEHEYPVRQLTQFDDDPSMWQRQGGRRRMLPSDCSSIGLEPYGRTGSPRASWPSSARSVICSTACPSGSSLRRPRSHCCRRRPSGTC
ncbi:MAG: hypothetical protein ACRDWI_08495 [Jiangellaceae bacterium]